MKKLSLSLFLLVSVLVCVQAQNLQVLYGLDKLYQGSYLNPAFIPNNRVVVSMPSFYNNLSVSGPSYSDIVQKQNGEDIINVSSLLSNLQESNFLREDMEIQTLGLCFSLGPIGLQAYHKVRFNAFLNFPEELPSLIWEGNSQYLGQLIDIGSDFQLHSHSEFGIGASLKLSKLTLGARAKYLNGIGHLSTVRNSLGVLTDETDYSISLASDYSIESANTLSLDGLDSLDLNFSIGDINWSELFTQNNGFALDLGAQLELGKLELSVALNDIGYINFDSGVKNYDSNGDFSYDGLDISGVLGGQDVGLSGIVDTLANILNFSENNKSFRYVLPANQYIQAKYKFSDNWDIGLSYFHERFREDPVNALSLSAGAGIGSIFRIRGAYTIKNDTYSNIGLGVTAKLTFLELYVLTDNLMAVSDPLGSREFNILAGLNFAISRK